MSNGASSFVQAGSAEGVCLHRHGRSCLYANTQVRIEILSNGQNFNTHLRICMLKVCKFDKLSLLTTYRLENINYLRG